MFSVLAFPCNQNKILDYRYIAAYQGGLPDSRQAIKTPINMPDGELGLQS